jgi:transcription initiation factor TFIIIB Brf1 subunit/transcription initiation factor TFIIB
MISNILISDDSDLYYQLNINNNKKKKKLPKIKYDVGDMVIDIDDIEDYEKYSKLMESMYNEEGKKSDKNKKKIYCYRCDNDDIVEVISDGIRVCRGCGDVVSSKLLDTNPDKAQYNDDNKKDVNRYSHPISQLLPQSSTATTIAGVCSSRIKTLHGWSAMPYKERSLNEVFKIIQAKCHEGKILKCIEDDAKIIYKNISDCKHTKGKNEGKSIIIRGKNRMSVIAACIIFACKKNGKTRSPKEIAELFDLKHTEVTKGCKRFENLAKFKKIELNTNSTKPDHFIIRFCDELKIKKEYTEQAIQISNNVQKLKIASVHTPLSLATGSIYLMICLNKLDVQKRTIAEKFNVSQVTIAKAFKKLEPFMNILINNEMCNRLAVEIKKYQDDIKISEILKPKFIRFGIDIKKTLGLEQNELYNILNYDDNGNILIDNKLIVEHEIEIDNMLKNVENQFIKINLEMTEYKYKLLEKEINTFL